MSGYSQKEKQLLSAAGTIDKANFFRVYKPYCSNNHATSYHHGNEQQVPIFLISLYMTTQYLPFHRGDIPRIPGRKPPAPGSASVAKVHIQSSRDWSGMTIFSWLDSFSQVLYNRGTQVFAVRDQKGNCCTLGRVACISTAYSSLIFFFVTLWKCKPHA